MDADLQTVSKEIGGVKKGEGKAIVVILVGAPGSGKSTFCDTLMRSSTRPWSLICQDTIGNGKAQCLTSATDKVKEGKSVLIDRCNLDKYERADFVKLGGSQADVHAVVLDLPANLCTSRSLKRTEHEIVNRMLLQKKEFPKLSEGFTRITFCQNESDVQAAINTYSSLGPLDILPSGCFGQNYPDAITKFLKKVDAPSNAASAPSSSSDIIANQNTKGKESSTLDNVSTLAFPSISTAEFQFSLEKASTIIVEKVEEFVKNHDNVRLVLVDLSPGSKILSWVRTKAALMKIDSSKFLTFVGDITRLSSEGGLRCNVIANAANWRLKPGCGGVNAAIFSAAGPELEIATREHAACLSPGKAVGVPLPSTCPLFIREGVTHVIHVLGPNMNPLRPDCLNNNYTKGCKVLRDAYSSLFEVFASIPSPQQQTPALESFYGEQNKFKSESDLSGCSILESLYSLYNGREFKRKREIDYSGCKTIRSLYDAQKSEGQNQKSNGEKSSQKSWAPWVEGLHKIAMHPENHINELIEISHVAVVLNDPHPKAQKHLLVLARAEGVDSLSDVNREHLILLKIMHNMGLKYAKKFLSENESLIFRLGYHSVSSMRQLHLHVISQDFDSKHFKNRKHWNSFNSPFFRDSVDVIEEVTKNGKATLKDDESFLKMDLCCHRCRSTHRYIPQLKSHISSCRASFPPFLLQNGRLVVS